MALFGAVYAQIKDWEVMDAGNPDGCVVDGVPTFKCLEVVFGNVVFAASTFVMVVLLAMFIYGSFMYLTSLGNPEKVKKAQATFKFAIIGFILFISAFLILKIIDTLFLGGTGTLMKFDLETGITPTRTCSVQANETAKDLLCSSMRVMVK